MAGRKDPFCRGCNYLIKVKSVTTCHYNEASWCYREGPAYKSYSPHWREYACLVRPQQKNHIIFYLFFLFQWKLTVKDEFSLSVKVISIWFFFFWHIIQTLGGHYVNVCYGFTPPWQDRREESHRSFNVWHIGAHESRITAERVTASRKKSFLLTHRQSL